MNAMNNRLQKLEIIAELNSLSFYEENGEKASLIKVNLEDIEYINDKISPTEYESDRLGFLNKVRSKMPLLRAGSEKKERLEEKDYIQYS